MSLSGLQTAVFTYESPNFLDRSFSKAYYCSLMRPQNGSSCPRRRPGEFINTMLKGV